MEEIRARKVTRTDIRSSLTPSFAFPDLHVRYPKTVVQALVSLYKEYNQTFTQVIERNLEWETDYQYCFLDHAQSMPMNWIVQIDMLGLTDHFLEKAAGLGEEDISPVLRSQIFEIENSWALYQLLGRIGEQEDGIPSFYSEKTREMLDALRQRFGMPIALLAVTHAKWEAMRATEFGTFDGESLSVREVMELSGFDHFFGPDDFRAHVEENNGRSRYLLYVRASDPVEKLKRPETMVEHPLLRDSRMRRIIKAYAVTFNVDDPLWPVGGHRRINDTKRYMPLMNMAFEITNAAEFQLVCQALGAGRVLRAKPAQGTYGCYGHERGVAMEQDFRRRVLRGIRQRGSYLVQPEHEAPTVMNTEDGCVYAFIDRVFCGMTARGQEFLGGHREFLPADSQEAKAGRLHGNRNTVYAGIIPM